MREIILAFKEIVLCSEYASKIKEQRKREKKKNIHVKYLRLNIVLCHNIDDSLSEIKIKIIDKDANLTLNVFLIINTSLIIDDLKYKFKNKLIPAIRRNNEKMIYVNNNSSFKIFFKSVIDYIFEMNYDY